MQLEACESWVHAVGMAVMLATRDAHVAACALMKRVVVGFITRRRGGG